MKSTTKKIDPQARYEAASQGRRMAGWNPPNTGPVSVVAPALPALRSRIRDLVRNDPIAASAVRVYANSVVGSGIMCRSTTEDPELKAKITKVWNTWAKSASVCGADFYGLQVQVVRALITDGEALLRIVPRQLGEGLDVPFQLQPLESDMLPLLDADIAPGLPAGNVIRSGIELDKHGRRVAYWLHTQHPGERNAFDPATMTSELVRVPADQVMHVFDPHRLGQLRGVSPLAAVAVKLKHIGDFDDAVLERQHLANLFTAFIIRPTPSGTNDPMTGLPVGGGLDQPIATLEPGASVELLPGEDIKFAAPPDAGTNYSEYYRTQLLATAAGVGIPPEMLTGELRDVSDRTLRFSVGEFRRRVDQIIWTVLVPRFLQPTREAFGRFAVLGGQISMDELPEVENCTWAPQAQAAIHPTQDLQAAKMAVDAGFRSRASVIASFGDDPEQVDIERAEDMTRAAALGLQTPEEAKTAAEVAKLEAEAEAAQKSAQAATAAAQAARAKAAEAKASTDAVKAQQRTSEALREHETAAAADRAKVARLEVQAAEIGLRELKRVK